MKINCSKGLLHGLLAVLIVIGAPLTRAALYQWSDDPGYKNARNYLWIPEDCKRIRGLIYVIKNLNEGFMAEDPLIREVCRKQRLGIAYISQDPRSRGKFVEGRAAYGYPWSWGLSGDQRKDYEDKAALLKKPDSEVPAEKKAEIKKELSALDATMRAEADRNFQNDLDRLAEVSGYPEIAKAPIFIISHSMGGLPAWFMPLFLPERVWGSIPYKTGCGWNPPSNVATNHPDNIPYLYINQEPIPSALVKSSGTGGLDGRKAGNNFLVGRVVDWGGIHFDYNEDLVRIVAMFIDKAAQRRLPDEIPTDGSLPKLKEIKPESGWLASAIDDSIPMEMAPESDFRGDKTKAFWYFDKEMADAAVNHLLTERSKKPQSLGILANGKPVEPNVAHWGELVASANENSPDPEGLSVKIEGIFLPDRKVGQERTPEPTGHGDPSLIEVALTGGSSVVKTGKDTFQPLSWNSEGFPNNWLVVRHPGDKEYARTTYQIMSTAPDTRFKGQGQTIKFDPIRDVKAGTEKLTLKAESNIPGMKVSFHVISGPAELVDGNTLRFTPIPPGAKYPMKVIVMAYQLGCAKEPLVKEAPLVVREFTITKP